MLNQLTIAELTELLNARKISARDIVRACLDHIERVEHLIRAFISLDPKDILAQADKADELRANNTTAANKPLLGIPIGIKDIIAVRGAPLTCGSRILANYVSPYDATVTEKLKAAGAILMGRLNLDEFAMGSSTENSAFGPTHNPWALDRVPGGSSGGAAAAVAADECPAALGSDTGGSIRQPAAFCGVVGLKPTYGRVSRYGLVAYASSLDQIGPITKTVRDAALLLQVISGYDPRDSSSVNKPVPEYCSALRENIRGVKVGLPREYISDQLHPEVRNATLGVIKTLEELGAVPVEISLPHTEYAVAAYYLIAPAEASSNLARYDGVRYGLRVNATDPITMCANTRGAGFGAEVKRRIMLGTYALSSGYYEAYYLRAQKVRTLIRQDFLRAFENVDVIVSPVSPTPPFMIGEKSTNPLEMYLSDIFTLSCNLAGICGISVPCGFTSHPRLPIGIQFLGPPFGEETIIKIAYAYERATPWHKEKPPLPSSNQ